MLVVAIDIGGTFTDLLGFDEARAAFVPAKSLTTPANLVQGIIDCLNKSGIKAGAIDELIHGSTTAINTLIERKGSKTALLVTRGTRDVYIIGRGNRPEAYNLLFHKHRPLVPLSRLTHGFVQTTRLIRVRNSTETRLYRANLRCASGVS